MDRMIDDFESLKISAFSKYSKLTGNINNVTIGPSSARDLSVTQREKTPKLSGKKPLSRKEKTLKTSPLPLSHVLKEFETQRKEKVQEIIDKRYMKFEDFTQKHQKENEWFQKQQDFIQSVQNAEHQILQTLSQYDANQHKKSEQMLQHYQQMVQKKLRYEEQLAKQKEQQRVLNENIDKIRKFQLEFRSVYQEIIAVVKTCKSNEELKTVLSDSFKLLRTLPESFDAVISKCKLGSIGEEQLAMAANVLVQIKSLKVQIEEAVTQINAKKSEEAKVPVQPQVKPNSVLANVPESSRNTKVGLSQFVSEANFRKYNEVKQFLAQHSQLFGELLTSEQMKQFRFDCKKAVNIPVNAISGVNAEHLRDKYVKLNSLLAGKTVSVADKQINAARHPQGIPFCMDLLAKKLVLQGDLMVSSNPEAAFCYATVIVSLWNDFPDFGKLLLGYFYTQCPYLVPFYIPKTEDQSNEEYYTSLGYHYVDGQIEKQDKFLKRMTGILRLYFAITIAKPKNDQTKNPYDIKNAWNFLAAILKLDPQLDITATALHIFLETVGFEMEKVYGAEFKKLVRIIIEKFMPVLKKFDSGGPVTRLDVLLQNYKKTGHFEKPHGLLPNNFW